jgi:hypothetical protein
VETIPASVRHNWPRLDLTNIPIYQDQPCTIVPSSITGLTTACAIVPSGITVLVLVARENVSKYMHSLKKQDRLRKSHHVSWIGWFIDSQSSGDMTICLGPSKRELLSFHSTSVYTGSDTLIAARISSCMLISQGCTALT